MALKEILESKKENLNKLKSSLERENLTSYIFSYEANYASRPIFTNKPDPLAIPYMWKYSTTKKLLKEVAETLTVEESERRNATLVNPGLKDFVSLATTPTIYSSIQVLQPGDVAKSHHHTVDAFRFVIEAPHEKAYSVVNGAKLPMRGGDLILTPNWAWHDHANEGDDDVIFVTGQNAVLVYWIGASFYEKLHDFNGEDRQSIITTDEEIVSTFGEGIRPSYRKPGIYNPLVYYPFNRVEKTLTMLAEKEKGSPCDGIIVDYVNPLDGGPAMPGMRISMRLIKPKTELDPVRKTENMIIVSFEGSLKIELIEEGKTFEMQPFNAAVIPSWTKYRIVNEENERALAFSYSDSPVFKSLSQYRESSQ